MRPQWFIRLMKALLLGRAIAKSPLKDANGIHALEKSMIAFKVKGTPGEGPREAAHHHAPPLDAQAHGAVRRQHIGCFLQRLAAPLCMCARVFVLVGCDIASLVHLVFIKRRSGVFQGKTWRSRASMRAIARC